MTGGVGEFLMRKMGWKTGEGLGRNREGTVEPIIIDFKVDRKGMKQQNSSQLNISSRNIHTHFGQTRNLLKNVSFLYFFLIYGHVL